jgi:Na+-transporting methylmalonyl-CoA/oxaloacetate decarboxylase beta subunit
VEGFLRVFQVTGLGGFALGNLVAGLVGVAFIYLAIEKHCEPLPLISTGYGILLESVLPS